MIWELVLLLAADEPDVKPRHVTPAGEICTTGMRCEPLLFENRLVCTDFVIEHGPRWRRQTGADVVAVCKQYEDGEVIS